MRFETMPAALVVLAMVMAACAPAASTPTPRIVEPGASGRPTLPVPFSSGKAIPSPTIEVPPPID